MTGLGSGDVERPREQNWLTAEILEPGRPSLTLGSHGTLGDHLCLHLREDSGHFPGSSWPQHPSCGARCPAGPSAPGSGLLPPRGEGTLPDTCPTSLDLDSIVFLTLDGGLEFYGQIQRPGTPGLTRARWAEKGPRNVCKAP